MIIISPLWRDINYKQQDNIRINNLIKKKNLIKHKVALNKNTANKLNISINTILNTLEMAANKNQIIIQKIEKYKHKPDYLWDSYQVNLTVAGQYQYIINFINAVAQYYSLVTFDGFELQKINNSPLEDEFTLNIIMTIHHNKININNFSKKNSCFLSQPKNYIKNKDALHSWSMQELQFVGSIKQHNKIIGFVTDPMGETHQIAIGDKIGLKQNIITNIDEHGIITNVQKIN